MKDTLRLFNDHIYLTLKAPWRSIPSELEFPKGLNFLNREVIVLFGSLSRLSSTELVSCWTCSINPGVYLPPGGAVRWGPHAAANCNWFDLRPLSLAGAPGSALRVSAHTQTRGQDIISRARCSPTDWYNCINGHSWFIASNILISTSCQCQPFYGGS